MDAFVIVYRLGGLAIAAFWLYWLFVAARQPPDWKPPRAETFPFRVSRNLFLLGGVLGVIAGLGVFVLSFVIFP